METGKIKKTVLNTFEEKYMNMLPLNKLSEYVQCRYHIPLSHSANEISNLLRYLSIHKDKKINLLTETEQQFREFTANLVNHLKKEEYFMFAYINKMAFYKNEKLHKAEEFGGLQKSIQSMKKEHANEMDRYSKITLPFSAIDSTNLNDETIHMLVKYLKEFEEELKRLLYIENNVLYPKAYDLEKELTSSSDL